jgi:hypothetical protein
MKSENAGRSARFSSLAPMLAICALALAGCAQTQLRPAAEAQRVPNQPLAAVSESGGVRMVVQPEAWRGAPEHLDRELTPLKVTIENQGDQPVRVRYEDFVIETGRGMQYTPLPPLNIKGEVTETADRPVYLPRYAIAPYAIVPRFGHTRFYLAPWYMSYYSGLRPWAYPWRFNGLYYDTYYPRWTVKLPTADMLEMAIPEGVIDAGGTLSGFLYFPDLDDELQRIVFKANLSGAREGKQLATLQVPFEVS